MLDFLESLPLPVTAAMVAAMSVALLFALSRAYIGRWLWVPALLIPFALSYFLYWTPVWRGANSSEYSAWAPLLIGTWFVFGAIACSVLVAVLLARRSKRTLALGRKAGV